MNDTPDKKPLKLQLTRTVDAGKVQQTFARGRTNTVTVEVKKTRTFERHGGKLVEQSLPKSDGADGTPPAEENSLQARLQAIKQSGADRTELPPPPKQDKKQEIIPDIDIPVKEDKHKVSKKDSEIKDAKLDIEDENEESGRKKEVKKEVRAPIKTKAVKGEKKEKVRLTLTNAMEQEERIRSLASMKRQRQKVKRQSETEIAAGEKQTKEVVIPESITVSDLAGRMAVRQQEVVRELMKLGVMAAGNHLIDADTAELIVSAFGHKFKRVAESDVEDVLKEIQHVEGDLRHRPPVVTIMGHVDHGKTSLLDALRSTNVTEGEAGGITQHIGAYQVTTDSGKKVTFLDTPGHAAFTAMRARGAKVTDIVVLVVAADDGIMPQTIEAINHAKAANVPIIVAINKIDKPDAKPQRVREMLLQHELVTEDMGGQVICVEVSAKQKTNLDGLLEAILLQSEMLDLKAAEEGRAIGAVVEARVDRGRGVVATLLVQRGTLRLGDIVVAGLGYGRIKAILDDKGKNLEEALPSMPVEILGLGELPDAGDAFNVVPAEKQAREIIEYREKTKRDKRAIAQATTAAGNREKLFQSAGSATSEKELRFIIKGDVQGSVEAIVGSLEKLSGEKVRVKVIHFASGGVSESDVTLATATDARVIAFNVRSEAKARDMAERDSVPINYYSIIYDLIDDVRGLIEGSLDTVKREEFIGTAQIQQVFKVTKVGKVAGCIVRDGVVKRGAGVRLIRDNVVIHEGKLKTLKRFKDEVAEVKAGIECGMAFENYEDIREGDMIEAFEIIETKGKL
jgi:translation initiation factor IF-2